MKTLIFLNERLKDFSYVLKVNKHHDIMLTKMRRSKKIIINKQIIEIGNRVDGEGSSLKNNLSFGIFVHI